MPVSMYVQSDYVPVVEKALKGKSIVEYKPHLRSFELTRENVIPFYDELKAFHTKQTKTKSKTVIHLENCYALEKVMTQVDRLIEEHFADLRPPEPANDPDIGLIKPGEIVISEENTLEYWRNLPETTRIEGGSIEDSVDDVNEDEANNASEG